MPKIILIGDSIRMGYLPCVEAELKGEAEIWGPEHNGGDSRNVLAQLDQWLGREADLVHINCGLHDLKREFDKHETQVSLSEYAAHVRTILNRIQDASMSVIWATITPVNEKWHHEHKSFDRREDDVRAYNAAALEVVRDLDVPIDDLYEVVNEMGRDENLDFDGVHFTPEGYAKLGRAVAEAVRNQIG